MYYFLLCALVSLFWSLSLGFSLVSVTPKALPINTLGYITLEGNGLGETTDVIFEPINGGPPLSFTPDDISNSSIRLQVLSGFVTNKVFGTFKISDDDQASWFSNRLLFHFYKQPSFGCCTPTEVSFSGTVKVTIQGTDFFFGQDISVELSSPWTEKTIVVEYVDSQTLTFRAPATSYSKEYEGDYSVEIRLAIDGMHYISMSSGPGLRYFLEDPIKVAFVYLGEISALGWTFSQNIGRKEVEMAYSGSIQTEYIENVDEAYDNVSVAYIILRDIILNYCRRNFSLIFTGSFGFQGASLAASKHPACQKLPTHLVSATGEITDENLSTMFGRVFQAKYLAGMTAGYMLGTTKRKDSMCVGYLGGYPIAEVHRGYNAFLLGCQRANPNCKVKVTFLMTWDDPPLERAAAEYMWEVEKCDIIAQETDSAEPSFVYFDKGGYSIGYNSDQSSLVGNTVLTSPYVKWSVLYDYFINKIINNEPLKSTAYWPGMNESAASIWPFSNFVDVITRSRVTEAWQELQSDDRKVFCRTPDKPLTKVGGAPFEDQDFGPDDCLTRVALETMTYSLSGVEISKENDVVKWGRVIHGDGGVPIFLAPIIPEINYERPLWFAVVFMLFSSLGIIAVFGTCGFMWKHRENEWFKTHIVFLMWFILLGILLLFINPFILWPARTDNLCIASSLLEHFALALIAPPIFIKTYDIHLKYDGTNRKSRWTDDTMFLSYVMGGIFVVFWVYTSIRLSLHPPSVTRSYVQSIDMYVSGCTALDAWDLVLFAPEALSLLCAMNMVFLHRKIPKKFNEAKYIGFALYTVFVLGMILIPVAMLTGKNYPELLDILANFGILVVAWSVYLSLFAVKMAKIIRGKIMEDKKQKKKNSMSMSISSTTGIKNRHYLGASDAGSTMALNSSAKLNTNNDKNTDSTSPYETVSDGTDGGTTDDSGFDVDSSNKGEDAKKISIPEADGKHLSIPEAENET